LWLTLSPFKYTNYAIRNFTTFSHYIGVVVVVVWDFEDEIFSRIS
jgi:hypothetical protein